MAVIPSLTCLGGEVAKFALPHIQDGLGSVYQATKQKVLDTTQYNDTVENLRKKQPTISWVQREADKASNKGADVNINAVRELRKDEDTLRDDARKLLEDFDKLKKDNGFTFLKCMPNLWTRHRIGRRARKCTDKIVKFRNNILTETILDETPPGEVTDDSRINCVKSNACELQSRVQFVNDLIGVVNDDSIQRFGVWGPAGAGKTILITQVLYEVVQKKLVDQQVHIHVPKEEGENSIEAQIQEQIVRKFCPAILDDAKELTDRAIRLREWFNVNTEKRAVIILDGLWRRIDLDEIGIPNNDEKVCNVIVTAKDMDLLVNDMGLSRESTLEVEPLSEDEATKLFLYTVTRSRQTIDEEKKSAAQKLVKYCGGLPSLIKQQASILTNHRDIYAWHDALREVKFQNANKMLEPVEEILSTWSSNEKERKEISSLFSLCGLFGESSFLVRDLIIHCWALGILTQEGIVDQTKNRAKRLLHILRARSLVRGDNHRVEISDLFREVALLIASKENYLFVRNGSAYKGGEFKKCTKEDLQECTALSIDVVDILKDHPELEYHNLKMLQIGSEQYSTKIGDDEFFNHMKELGGLHLKYIDFISSSFPSTIQNLENLQTLCLVGCRLKDVRHIGKLKKLQILKISGSDIIQLPKDVGDLTDLRLLDLRGCLKLQVIEHGVFGKLKQLEELYLDDCFDKWEAPHYKLGPLRRNASFDELDEMTCLSTLHVYVPNTTMLPENLKLEKLERYRILLGDVRNCSEENVKVRTLRLDLSDSSSILCGEGVKRMMHRTKSLYLKGMMRMPKASILQLCPQGFPCLNDLHLQDSDSIEYIVESSELILAFPNLETLTLVNLKNLRKICNGRLMDESFGRLSAVTVEKCHALENLFDFSLMERISALKKIEVKDCENIKEIVSDDIGCKEGTRKKTEWNELRHLSLENLEEIVSFCNTDTRQTSSESSRQCSTSEPPAFFDGKLISFPGLESLSLIGLPKARRLLHQNIPLPEWSNLQSLTVDGFEDAFQPNNNLFYSQKATPQQEPARRKLTLGFSCLKAQVDHDSQIQFPGQDKKHGALQMKALYPERHLQGNSRHQNLRYLKVCGCETLKFLFTTSMAQKLPHLTKLTIANCKMMEEVIQVDIEDSGLKSREFQELTTFCLESLENLTTFSQGNISFSFPSLKSLKISDCRELTALFTDLKDGKTKEEISRSLFHAGVSKIAQERKHVSPTFPSLDSLDICNMNNLKRIWRCQVYRDPGDVSSGSSSKVSALLETFLRIKKLDITHCGSLEKILVLKHSLDAKTSNDDNCLHAQLKEVSLEDLTNIEDVWAGSHPRGRKIRYKSLQKVSLCNCPRIESMFPASMTNDLLGLQSLEVNSCHGMKHLIREENSSSGNKAPQFFFPDVKTIKLWKLENLMSFYRGPHCSEWPSLEELTVSQCDNFIIFGSEYKTSRSPLDPQPLFSVNKNSFCKLTTLELSQNRLMKKIWPDSSPKELFRNLKVLKLRSSREEPVILPDEFLDKSPHFESLQMHNVPIKISRTRESEGSPLQPVQQLVTKRSLREMELKMIPEMTDLEESLNSLLGAASYSFTWLTSLNVSECHHLAHLFTYSTAKCLRSLTGLTIANCDGMKVVVASGGKTKDEVVLDRLECLTLESLRGLKRFCKENYEFKFPLLEKVIVRECSKMTAFSHGETSSPNLFKVELEGEQIDIDEERNLNKIMEKKLRKPGMSYQHLIPKSVLPVLWSPLQSLLGKDG